MHVAILFYGRLRGFREHYEQFNTLFGEDVKIDFFLSHSKELNDDQNLEEFIQLYKPIAVQNDPMDFYEELYNYNSPFYYPSKQSIRNMFSHFTNKHRVFQLMENHMKTANISYDYIVSSRIDLYILNKINLNLLHPRLIYIPFQLKKDNTIIDDPNLPIKINNPELMIYIKIFHDAANFTIVNPSISIISTEFCSTNEYYAYIHGIKDQIAIGTYTNMKIHSELIHFWERYLKRRILNHPEHILLYHLYENHIPIKRFQLQYQIE